MATALVVTTQGCTLSDLTFTCCLLDHVQTSCVFTVFVIVSFLLALVRIFRRESCFCFFLTCNVNHVKATHPAEVGRVRGCSFLSWYATIARDRSFIACCQDKRFRLFSPHPITVPSLVLWAGVECKSPSLPSNRLSHVFSLVGLNAFSAKAETYNSIYKIIFTLCVDKRKVQLGYCCMDCDVKEGQPLCRTLAFIFDGPAPAMSRSKSLLRDNTKWQPLVFLRKKTDHCVSLSLSASGMRQKPLLPRCCFVTW